MFPVLSALLQLQVYISYSSRNEWPTAPHQQVNLSVKLTLLQLEINYVFPLDRNQSEPFSLIYWMTAYDLYFGQL